MTTTLPADGGPALNLKQRFEWVFKGKDFGIIVSCHGLDRDAHDNWAWCLYALIYDSHPLFNDAESAIENLPWHGDCTYEERFFQEPARGIRYQWQRKGEWLKIGCDYSHYGDEFYRSESPEDGIPASIQRDAQALFDALRARQQGES